MANEFKIRKGLIVSGSSQLSGSVFIVPGNVPEAPTEETVLVLTSTGQVAYRESAQTSGSSGSSGTSGARSSWYFRFIRSSGTSGSSVLQVLRYFRSVGSSGSSGTSGTQDFR